MTRRAGKKCAPSRRSPGGGGGGGGASCDPVALKGRDPGEMGGQVPVCRRVACFAAVFRGSGLTGGRASAIAGALSCDVANPKRRGFWPAGANSLVQWPSMPLALYNKIQGGIQ